MATISTNTTLTLDGFNLIDINGVDQVSWSTQTFQGLFIEPDAANLTLTLNLIGSWAGTVISATGSLDTIIADDASLGVHVIHQVYLGSGADVVTLNSTEVQALNTAGGNDIVDVSGFGFGFIETGTGDDTVTVSNSTWITALYLDLGDNTVTLQASALGIGTISAQDGADTIYAHAAVDMITTRGGIDRIETSAWVDMINAGEDADVLVLNASARAIDGGGGGDDILTGSGTWIQMVHGNDGNDLIRANGQVDFINGGYGDDSIVAGTEWIGNIASAWGKDTVTLGGGQVQQVDLAKDADRLIVGIQLAPNLRIIARGGEGVSTVNDADSDTVDFSAMTAALRVSLAGEVARSTQAYLTLVDFENATGGQGNDTITGDAQDNILRGGGGRDLILAGRGVDRLYGGAGADSFRFYDTDNRQDIIYDLTDAQGDRIDLRAIDANRSLRGDQAFQFIGTSAFHGRAGELRIIDGDGWVRVSGDMNGDRVADVNILLPGLNPPDVTATDFLL